MELFFAVLFFAGGPAYAAAISVAVVTSRRILEVLLLRGDSDEDLGVDQTTMVHTCFQTARLRQALARSELGGPKVVARPARESVDFLEDLAKLGLQWAVLPDLEKKRTSHELPFWQTGPLRKSAFTLSMNMSGPDLTLRSHLTVTALWLPV